MRLKKLNITKFFSVINGKLYVLAAPENAIKANKGENIKSKINFYYA